jgi:TPR repeat protein
MVNLVNVAFKTYKDGPPGGTKLPPIPIKLDEMDGGLYGKGASGSGNPALANNDLGVRESDLVLLYRLQAEAGDPSAQYLLGYHYYTGSDTIPVDYKKALGYFLAAAKQYPEPLSKESSEEENAAFRQASIAASTSAGYLGLMYWRGEGVEVDAIKARMWFERGVSQENGISHAYLGLMYLKGEGGLEKDVANALKHFRESANLGNSFGRVLLAEQLLGQFH